MLAGRFQEHPEGYSPQATSQFGYCLLPFDYADTDRPEASPSLSFDSLETLSPRSFIEFEPSGLKTCQHRAFCWSRIT